MASTYIPYNDSQFRDWLDKFASYLNTHEAHFGFQPAELDELGVVHPAFDSSLTNQIAAVDHARALVADKKTKRADVERVVRALVARIKAYPATTDTDLRELGIIPDSVGTTGELSIESSGDKPHAVIDISARMRHVLRIQNETLTGSSRAKPAGAIGCEVWRKVGEPPTGEEDIVYVGLATRSPYIVEYSGSEAGQTAYYMMRWVRAGGIKGAWSDPEPATIAA